MPFKPHGRPPSGFRSWATGDAKPQLSQVPDRAPDPKRVDDLQDMLTEAREAGAGDARAELEAELVQLREIVESVGPLVDELEGMRKQALTDAADTIAQVVRLFARRVVGDALAMNPDALTSLVKEAIAQLPDHDDLEIAVSAQDSDTLSRTLPAHLRERVVVQPDIERGVVVRTKNASLDATLATAERGLDAAVQEWLAEQWWADGESR